jgi:hypothetical protein
VACARNHYRTDRDCFSCAMEGCEFRECEQSFSEYCEACRKPLTRFTCVEVDDDGFFCEECAHQLTSGLAHNFDEEKTFVDEEGFVVPVSFIGNFDDGCGRDYRD